jgi:hypothetical protein
MATVNYTGFDQGSGTDPTDFTSYDTGSGLPAGIASKLGIMKRRVDCSKDGITGAAADVYEAIYLKAGVLVLAAWMDVITVESTAPTSTMALGITGGFTGGFVTAVVITSTGVKAVDTGLDASAYRAIGGYLAASENTIDILTAIGGFTEAVVDVYALVLDLNP